MKKQTGIWIDSTAIIVTLQDGKRAVSEIQSDLEFYHEEGDKGSFLRSAHGLTKVL
jgi:hypothetical protein